MASQFAKLTKRTVDGAMPQATRYLVWDTELKGFALRVAASGTKTYILRYRPRGLGGRGPKRFETIGRHGALTPEQARLRARALLGEVAAGQDPGGARKQQIVSEMTVAELAEAFLREHVFPKRKAGTAAGYAHALRKHVVPRFGEHAAQVLSTNELSQLHLSLKDRPYQANRVLAVVGSMYQFACKRGLVSKGTNPAVGIERFGERSRERYLTGEELKRLGDALRLGETSGLLWETKAAGSKSKHLPSQPNRRTLLAPEAVLAIRLLLLTGARLREVLNLEWRYVDLDRGLLLLPDSKSGRKTIVLSNAAVDLMRKATRRGAFVIPGIDGTGPRVDLKKPWAAVQRNARLEGVRLHDLRHTFASIGAGASLGLPIVGKLLGHTQSATTARYAHLDADPLRRASDLIGKHLADALAETFVAPLIANDSL